MEFGVRDMEFWVGDSPVIAYQIQGLWTFVVISVTARQLLC